MAGIHLLFKMHFVRQNYSATADEMLRPYADGMSESLRAQMIHEKGHTCRTGSKNWDFTELLL